MGSILKSENKFLVLTTREYILKRGQIKFKEQLNDDVINLKKCIVDASKYTRYEKAEILFNHLYYSEMDWEQILFFKKKEYYNDIITHSNYSPRLIEDVTTKFSPNKELARYEGTFYIQLKKYLDDPYSYWQTLFEKQSIASKILALNLFISCEPLEIGLLKRAFDNTCKAYKKWFDDLIINPDTFRISIRELSDTFLTVEEGESDYQFVSFQNPSVNDFLLKFLRERQDWISVLIEGAIFWNQLTFVFTTEFRYDPDNNHRNKFGETIDELEDERYVSGERIMLSSHNSGLLMKKAITDFDRLKYSNLEKREFTSQFTVHNLIETIEASKLRDLTIFYDIKINNELREFISNKVENIFAKYKNGESQKLIHNSDAMLDFSNLICRIKSSLSFDPLEIIELYKSSITYSFEYYGLQNFKDAFPEQYHKCIGLKIKSIRKQIRKQIISDLNWLDPDDYEEGGEIDRLIDSAESIFEDFGMRMTKKFKNEMEFAAFDGYSRKAYRGWEYDKKQAKKEKELRKQELKEREKEEKEIEKLFNQAALENEIDGLIDLKKNKEESDTDYFKRAMELTLNKRDKSGQIIKNLKTLAFETIKDIKDNFTYKYLKKHIGRELSDIEMDNLLLTINPLIIERNRRYNFGNNDLRNYLVACHVTEMHPDEKDGFMKNKYLEMYFDDPDFHSNYWSIWNELDSDMFSKFVKIQWNSFKEELDYSSNHKLFISIVKYIELEVSVGIDSKLKGMQELGDGSKVDILMNIFQFYSQYDIFYMPARFFDSETYEDFSKDNSSPFITNPDSFSEMIKYVVENFEGKEYRFWIERDIKNYDIPLYKDVLELFDKTGMIDTTINIFKELDGFFNKL